MIIIITSSFITDMCQYNVLSFGIDGGVFRTYSHKPCIYHFDAEQYVLLVPWHITKKPKVQSGKLFTYAVKMFLWSWTWKKRNILQTYLIYYR